MAAPLLSLDFLTEEKMKKLLAILTVVALTGCDSFESGLDRRLHLDNVKDAKEIVGKVASEVSPDVATLLREALAVQLSLVDYGFQDKDELEGLTFREIINRNFDYATRTVQNKINHQAEEMAILKSEKEEALSKITVSPIKAAYDCPGRCMVAFDVTNNSNIWLEHFDIEGSVTIQNYGLCSFSTNGYTKNLKPKSTQEMTAYCVSNSSGDYSKPTAPNEGKKLAEGIYVVFANKEIKMIQEQIASSEKVMAEIIKGKQLVN